MYKSLISSYIKNMDKRVVINYILKNYPNTPKEDIDVIYKYIKTRWEEVYNEEDKVLDDFKNEVSPKTYEEVLKLLRMVSNIKK